MAGTRALEAVAQSIVNLISTAVSVLPDTQRPHVRLTGAGSGQAGLEALVPSVVVHAYSVSAESDVVGHLPAAHEADHQSGTPLRVDFLVTAVADNPAAELACLGLVAHGLNQTPVLPSPAMDPVGAWEDDDRVSLAPITIAHADLINVFVAVGIAPRPAITYAARGITIRG